MEIIHIDKKRKQRFAFLCVAFSLPAIICFAVVDFLEGDRIEFIIDLLMVVVFIIGLTALVKLQMHMPLYRIALAILTLTFLYNVSIGAGKGTAIYWLFPFPLVFLFFLGKKEGAVVAAIFYGLLSLLLINPFSFNLYAYDLGTSLRFLASLLLVTFMAYALEASREKFGRLFIENHIRLVEEKKNLQQALGEIKTLHGLIPICSSCKKIRDDEGYWQQVEVYVSDHTHADFSHGLCPDCAEALYQTYRRSGSRGNHQKQAQA